MKSLLDTADEISRLIDARSATMQKLCERIEALEAALWDIADGYDNQNINHVDYRVRVYQIARAALDKDASK